MFYYTYPERAASAATSSALCNMSALSHALLSVPTGMQAAGPSSSSDDNPSKRRRTETMETILDGLELWSAQAKQERDELKSVVDALWDDWPQFLERVDMIRETDRERMDIEREAMEAVNETLLDAHMNPPQSPQQQQPAGRVQIDLITPETSPERESGNTSGEDDPLAPMAPVPPVAPMPGLAPFMLPSDLTRIDGLQLKQTSIVYQNGPNMGQPLPEYGLFTTRRIEKGAFVLFYTGAFYEKNNWAAQETNHPLLSKQLEKYALSTKSRRRDRPESKSATQVKLCTPPADPRVSLTGPPNLRLHAAAAINEPNKNGDKTSNVYAYDIQVNNVIGQGGIPEADDDGDLVSIIGFPIFACRDIEAGEELLWNYGDEYNETREELGYEAGPGCFDNLTVEEGNKLLQSHKRGHAARRLRLIWEHGMDESERKKYGVIGKQAKEDTSEDLPAPADQQLALARELVGFRAAGGRGDALEKLSQSTQSLSLKAAHLPNPNQRPATLRGRSTRSNRA